MRPRSVQRFVAPLLVAAAFTTPSIAGSSDRPNVLVCVADDWGWPHAGAYGDAVVSTPAFDGVADAGVLLRHAYAAAPSCTPSRNALLTGKHVWQLEEGANLWSTLHPRHAVFPLLLEEAGYHVGHCRKVWGPGDWRALGRESHPAGDQYADLSEFLRKRPDDTPFCFLLGAYDPHRPYPWQSGSRSGVDVDRVDPPADLPDHETVRNDIADYYNAVARFDRDVRVALETLEAAGLLENTIVIVTSDHGMPFPRHKANLYDSGSRVPLAIRWSARIPGEREVTDFVSLSDLAATILDACSVPIPDSVTGRSFLASLTTTSQGRVDAERDRVTMGLERHGQAQEAPNTGGYPSRAMRTDDYLLIWNMAPDRWPGGCPSAERAYCRKPFGNTDSGPTRELLSEGRDDEEIGLFYRLAFAKRPEYELYDLKKDPDQIENVYERREYEATAARLRSQLLEHLKSTGDPRVVGGGEAFDTYPFRRG